MASVLVVYPLAMIMIKCQFMLHWISIKPTAIPVLSIRIAALVQNV